MENENEKNEKWKMKTCEMENVKLHNFKISSKFQEPPADYLKTGNFNR
jgi:hypothetical protein